MTMTKSYILVDNGVMPLLMNTEEHEAIASIDSNIDASHDQSSVGWPP